MLFNRWPDRGGDLLRRIVSVVLLVISELGIARVAIGRGLLVSQLHQFHKYLRRTLQAAPGIRSVTGMGLMLGLEIDIPAREFAERALREGVLVTTAKQKIRLLPALNIPMELLKTAAQALVHCAAE